MKNKVIISIVILFLTQCTTYYAYFQIKSDFYTKTEVKILKKTTNATNFGYGFDSEMQLDYVFKKGANGLVSGNGSESLSAVVNKISTKRFIGFYEKIYKLKVLTELKRDRFKENETWKYYTYLNNYLLPSLDEYYKLIEAEMRKKSPGYYANHYGRQKIIKVLVEEELQQKEMESDDYNFVEMQWADHD